VRAWLFPLLLIFGTAAAKDRVWQEGKVLDVQWRGQADRSGPSADILGGAGAGGKDAPMFTQGGSEKIAPAWAVEVMLADGPYLAFGYNLPPKRSPLRALQPGAWADCAVEGKNLWIRDTAGKQHKLDIKARPERAKDR
jgi:hypothetical protein